MLWLALHLPHLSLEANAPLPSPSAVVERGRIFLGDDSAQRAGIASGIGVAAARALAPGVTLLPRHREREEAALRTLACWAGCLTPRISLTSDTLLLEIGTCLRLFGGPEKLLAAAVAGVQEQGFSVSHAMAPTPLGAEWLARKSTGACCLDGDSLRQHLDALPVSVLSEQAATALKRFGLHTLADARRLPGGALARRIGEAPVHDIARAFGELPDPRADFVFPERFALPLPLPAAVENAAALLFAARRLTAALAGWLAARQSGVREFTLRLLHRRTETRLALPFAELTADGTRFERVLRERLERMALDAPVEALCLEAEQVAPLPGRSYSLLEDGGDASAGQEGIGALLERLAARLGEASVYRLGAHPDHRPECATRRVPLFGKHAGPASSALPRPLWLLNSPEALREVDGRPYRHGHLQLLAGPERIESGWWDAGESGVVGGGGAVGDVRRDYFVAVAADESWLWIYRDCRAPGGWFLQGFFS